MRYLFNKGKASRAEAKNTSQSIGKISLWDLQQSIFSFVWVIDNSLLI